MNNSNERGTHTSASSAQADLLCPGRHLAQVGLPDESSEAAERGDRIHAALAGQAVELTLEEQEMRDHCVQIEQKLVTQFFGTTNTSVFREVRYWGKVNPGGKILEHSGKPDVVYRAGTRALVIDYKTGRKEVAESPRNHQLRDNAVLIRGHFVVLTHVGTAVIQPSVTFTPDVCIYTVPDLDRSAEEMWVRVINSNRLDAPREAGEVQCQYCRAKKLCKEYQAWATASLPVTRSILDVPVVDWTPQQCAIAAESLGVAQQWLDGVKEHLKDRLIKDPESIPGWTLKEGAKREYITDPQAVFQRFGRLGGKLEQFMATITVGKTKLKEQLAAATSLKGQALEKSLKQLTDGLVEVKQDAPSLKKAKK